MILYYTIIIIIFYYTCVTCVSINDNNLSEKLNSHQINVQAANARLLNAGSTANMKSM